VILKYQLGSNPSISLMSLLKRQREVKKKPATAFTLVTAKQHIYAYCKEEEVGLEA